MKLLFLLENDLLAVNFPLIFKVIISQLYDFSVELIVKKRSQILRFD